jgi:hypothetical protein
MSENLYEEDKSTPASGKKQPTSKENSLLGRLKETVEKKVERPVVLVSVPSRPGVYLRITPNITQQQLRAWRRNSGEDSKNGLDPLRFAAYVVGNTTVGIEIDDEEVFDNDGYALNFASQVVLDMTDTSRPIPDAVREFFGVDPHLEAAALAILEASGYSDTVDTVDPTREHSKNS